MSCQALIYLLNRRKRVLLHGAVATAALVAGCDTVKVTKQETGSGSSVTVRFDRVEFEKQCEEYRQAVERRIAELDAEMARLGEKAQTAGADARAKIEEEKAELMVNLEKAKADLKEINAITAEKWDEFTQRSSAAMDELKTGFEQAFSKFNE
jgi:hypothetical protein